MSLAFANEVHSKSTTQFTQMGENEFTLKGEF